MNRQMEHEEMHFVVDKDTETRERAGASGTFQIACLSIEDPDRNSVEITKLVDQRKHFVSTEDSENTFQADLTFLWPTSISLQNSM